MDYRGVYSKYAEALRGRRRRLLEDVLFPEGEEMFPEELSAQQGREGEEGEGGDDTPPPDFGDGGGGGEEEEEGGMEFGDDERDYKYDDDFAAAYKDDMVDLNRRGHRHFESGVNESNYVLIDAHVLTTPTVADINNDGHVEILLSVSYFFDRAKYQDEPPAPGVDPSKYVAGGLVCYDLQSQDWAWSVHLDLTTDQQRWRAYVFGAPTVADLDGDGTAEVVVGTSLGLLYVLDATTGFALRGFPMQFGEIQAQVAVADLVTADHTGDLEMVFCDMNGNLVCVDRSGAVLWDRQLAGGSSATPTVGDVDGVLLRGEGGAPAADLGLGVDAAGVLEAAGDLLPLVREVLRRLQPRSQAPALNVPVDLADAARHLVPRAHCGYFGEGESGEAESAHMRHRQWCVTGGLT